MNRGIIALLAFGVGTATDKPKRAKRSVAVSYFIMSVFQRVTGYVRRNKALKRTGLGWAKRAIKNV
jgi:hypothetical protein